MSFFVILGPKTRLNTSGVNEILLYHSLFPLLFCQCPRNIAILSHRAS